LEKYMQICQSLSPPWIQLLRSEAGGSFMEYALVGLLILIVCMLLLLAWTKNA